MENQPPNKKERLLAALDQGMVMIHLDARRPGVLVPANLRTEHHLRLNLSYRFDPPDLAVSDWGVRSTLSFSGSRFQVAVPWSALFAVTSYVTQEFWLFAEDLPEELLEAATEKVPASEVPGAVPAEPPRAARPQLRDVSGDRPPELPAEAPAPVPESEAPAQPEPPRSPPSRSHLRVIK